MGQVASVLPARTQAYTRHCVHFEFKLDRQGYEKPFQSDEDQLGNRNLWSVDHADAFHSAKLHSIANDKSDGAPNPADYHVTVLL